METDVVCPDCGKVIAPKGAVENSLRCRCGETRDSQLSPDEVSVHPSISVNVPLAAERTEHAADEIEADETPSAPKTKACYICGKDLTGRIRLKDHLGRYWCRECAKADERAKKREEQLKCPDCGRVVPENKLVYFQTTRVCTTCFKAREKELEKKIKKAAAVKIHEKSEWQSIKVMAMIAVVLLVLGSIGYLMSR